MAALYKINYKSDFVLTINSDAGWAVPFCIKFWTGMPSHGYFAGFDGENYVNCRVGETPTQLLVMFDDHHMPIGQLRMQIAYHTTIEEFPDRKFDEVTNPINVTVDIDGTEYQVMLDFTGETGAEIDFSMPSSGVMSVNGKIGYVTLNAEDVGAQPTIEDLATIRSGAAAGATAVQPNEMTAALATKQDTIPDLATIRSGAAAGATAVQPAALQEGLAGKQDTISDLATIRSGAAAGATAVQPNTLQEGLAAKQDTISDLSTIRSGAAAGATAVQPATLQEGLARKQDTISDLATIRSGAEAGATAVQPAALQEGLAGKQDTISDLATIRSGAAAGATAVQPAAMNTALAAKQDTLTFDNTPTANSNNPVKSSGIKTALDTKQSTISTVNVTVDNNTGTPSGSASVSGSTLSLSFQNLKGATGATGATGPQGPQGERGLPGESGVTGDVSGFTVIQTIDPSATYGATDIAGAATVQATNAELTELEGKFINENTSLTVSPNSVVAFPFYVGVNYYISSNVNAVLSTRYVENGSNVETIGTVRDEILFTPTYNTQYLRIGGVGGTSANLTIKARGSLAQDYINAKSQQMLTAAEQKQARQNLGLGNGDIDTTPTAESGNVITSGGVYDIVGKTELSITSDSVVPLEMAVGKTYVIINTGTKTTPILSTRSTATGSNIETIATTILAGNLVEFTPSQDCHYLRVGSGNATTLSVFLKSGLQNEVYNLKKRVDTNDASIEELAEKTEIFTKAVVYDENLTDSYIKRQYINTSIAVGNTVDTTPVSNNGFGYIIYPCKQGDIFGITGNGGTTPRLWCFTDANYVKLSGNPTDIAVRDLFLTAPADGYFISNVNINNTYKLGVIFSDDDAQTIEGKVDSLVESVNELTSDEKVTKITDPHLLEWKIQGFTSTGAITTTNMDRCHLIVKVKAGSKITALQANGVKFQRGYKLSESDTTLTDYASYNYGTYEFPVDCIAYIGLVNSPAVRLYNDEIIDKISIELNVVDFVSKYSKKRNFTFGSPLALMYAGQHEDNTGFNLQTQPAAVYSAFDSLVAASDGWLEKSTLGVIYEGTENEETIYTYTTKPRGIHNGISAMKLPKVAIVCCLHGGEKMSAYAMHYLIHDMLYNSSKNAVIQYLRSCCTLTFIPIANPWGFKAGSRLNQNGVNLNRNFPTYAWDEYSDDTSDIGGINYKGTSPCSEEETKMVVTFLQKHQDASFAVDLHTNGGDTIAYYEISHVDVTATPSKSGADYEIQSSYAIPSAIFVNSLKAWLDENYGTQLGNVFYGNVLVDDNALRPTASNWIRESNNMIGFTYEVMAGSSTGYLGEQLTQYGSETIKAAAETLGGFLIRMIEHCSKQ